MEQKVIFNGQVFTLTRFWATEEPCLWITDPQQIGMPKMELVGPPDEYCIFLKNLTETELAQITSLDGAPLDVREELRQFLTGKDNPMALQDKKIMPPLGWPSRRSSDTPLAGAWAMGRITYTDLAIGWTPSPRRSGRNTAPSFPSR